MRLVPLLAVLVVVLLCVWWFSRTPPERVAKVLRQAPLWIGAGLLIFLVATGRLPWLFALLGAAVPFVQRAMRLLFLLPMLQRLLATFQAARSAGGPSGGQTSQVRTRFLLMELEHDTGAMSGKVLEGPFQGRRLSDLSLPQLLDLLDQCATADAQSAAVLEAYLDREHGPDWRNGAASSRQSQTPPPNDHMTREEAYEILGLAEGARREEILAAHKSLMQRLHPDRGGSTYLAAIVNKAKDVLLG